MIPEIADLKPTQPTAAAKAAAKALFEACVGRAIKEAAEAGHTKVTVTGLKEYPETRAKLIAEGYTLKGFRDMGVTTLISWS